MREVILCTHAQVYIYKSYYWLWSLSCCWLSQLHSSHTVTVVIQCQFSLLCHNKCILEMLISKLTILEWNINILYTVQLVKYVWLVHHHICTCQQSICYCMILPHAILINACTSADSQNLVYLCLLFR